MPHKVYFRAVNQELLDIGGGLEGVIRDLNTFCHVVSNGSQAFVDVEVSVDETNGTRHIIVKPTEPLPGYLSFRSFGEKGEVALLDAAASPQKPGMLLNLGIKSGGRYSFREYIILYGPVGMPLQLDLFKGLHR